jgi:spermidine/putrescine transport system ATP-binding protein
LECNAAAPCAFAERNLGTESRNVEETRSAVRDMNEENRENILTISGLHKHFGKVVALKNINLEIRKGEILTLLGPSGCGKSTIMRIMAGFIEPTKGELRLRGQDMSRMPPERRPINMVFQRYALFPHLDVFDNIAFGLRRKKLPEAETRRRALDMMELVQLDDLASRWVNELSGGQAQRVALARALVMQPEILMLDEPLAALDLKIRQHMLAELMRIQRTTGTTFVYVTHDQDEALFLSTRIALMDHGIIKQVGTPDELYFHPESLFAAKFLGETNIIPGTISDRKGNAAIVQFEGGKAEASRVDPVLVSGDKVSISVRPASIDISPSLPSHADDRMPPNKCRATLVDITPIGSRVIYAAELKDGTILRAQRMRGSEDQPFAIGQSVSLSWKEDAMAILST